MYDHMFIRKWTSQEDIDLFPTEGESNPSYDAYDEDIGVLNIYFESPTCFEYIRRARMTVVDFIAQMGGLFGACIGFSFITAFEVIQTLTSIPANVASTAVMEIAAIMTISTTAMIN